MATSPFVPNPLPQSNPDNNYTPATPAPKAQPATPSPSPFVTPNPNQSVQTPVSSSRSSGSSSSGGGGSSPTQNVSSLPPSSPSTSSSPFVTQLPASRPTPIMEQSNFENKGTLFSSQFNSNNSSQVLSSQELPQVLQARASISSIQRNIPTMKLNSGFVSSFMQQYGNVESTAQTLVSQRESKQASFAQKEAQALYDALTLPKIQFSSIFTGKSYDATTPTVAAKMLLASSPRLASGFVDTPRYALENAYLEGQALAGSKVQRAEAVRQATTTQPAAFFESFSPIRTSTPFKRGGEMSFNPSGAIGLGTAIIGGFEAASTIPSRISNPLKGISSDINLELIGQVSSSGKALPPEVKMSYTQQSPTASGFFGRQAQTDLTIGADGSLTKVTKVGKTTYTYEQLAGAPKGTLTTSEANQIVSSKTLNAIDLSNQQTARVLRSSLYSEEPQITRQGQDMFTQQTTTGRIPLKINSFTGQVELQFSMEKSFAGSAQSVSGGAYYGQSTLTNKNNFVTLARNAAKDFKSFSQDVADSLTPSRLITSKRGSLSMTQDATQTGGYGGTVFDTDFAGRLTQPPSSFSPESPVVLRNINRASLISEGEVSGLTPRGTIALRLPSNQIGGNNMFSAFASTLPRSIPTPQSISSSLPQSTVNPFVSPFTYNYAAVRGGTKPQPDVNPITQPDVTPTSQTIPRVITQPVTQPKTQTELISYPESFSFPRIRIPESPIGDNIPFFEMPSAIGSGGRRPQPRGKRKRFKGIYTKDITSFIFGDVIRAQKLPKLSRKSLGVVSGLGVRY